MSDPVVFEDSLKATIQQIGAAGFPADEKDEYEAFKQTVRVAGNGWYDNIPNLAGMGLFERTDDWCATAFVYLEQPQSVPPLDVALATADLGPPSGEFVRRVMPVRGSVMG